jgi:D-sedoheptulose 7-phosphate isomerase
MDTRRVFQRRIEESIELKRRLLADESLLDRLAEITAALLEPYRNGGKALFCGNGGSAADAQHLAAELSGRYYFDRPPLFAEALHVNTSYLTAVANDHSYGEIYCRLVRGMGRAGDTLVGLSTSGQAENVVNAIRTANEIGMTTVAFTGQSGGRLLELARYTVRIPSADTPRIQECHMLLGHTLCELVEAQLFQQT